MIYENIPVMIFMLATGYLLAVYLLLGLVKRIGKKPLPKSDQIITN